MREYRDLLQLLAEHPEWREELRRALLSDDFLTLPQIVRELAEAQRRTEQQVEELVKAQRRTEQRVEELAEAQRRTEERLEALAKRVDELAEAQKQSEERLTRLEAIVAELTEAQKRTEETLAALIKRVDHIEVRLVAVEQRLAKVDGRTLELHYERKAASTFGRILRRAKVVDLGEFEDRVSPYLSGDELQDLWRIDLLVQGYLREPLKGDEKPEAYLAVEVSVLVDREDVERAKRRANILSKAGLLAIPVAAGEDLTERALQMAENEGVVLVKDGSVRFIEQALQRLAQ